jgi:hypothetical protein
MKLALALAAGIAALCPSAPARAQGEVTITLTPEGQDLATALGVTPAELEMMAEEQINEAYRVNRAKDFLRAFADATSFSNRGIGVDYASNADGFMFGMTANVAVAVGDLGTGEADAEHPVAGVAPNFTFMGGLNFKKWNRPQLTVYANAFYRGGDIDQLHGSISSFGAHAQYKLFTPTQGGKSLVVKWGGFDVTGGIEFSRWSFGIADELVTDFPLDGDNGSSVVTMTSTGRFDLDTTAVVLPLEATTSLRLFYLVSLYGGAGIDLSLGKSRLDAALDSTLVATDPNGGDDVDMGSAQVTIDGSSGPSPGKLRGLLGVQVNIWKLKTFLQLNVMPIRAASVAFGLRVVL